MALWIILVFAAMGAGIGIAMAKNAAIPYGLGNQYGKQHMKQLGVDDNNDTNDRWDA